MTRAANPERYKHHRFPPEIISHAVWLYFRFTLSYRDVEEMMLARGIVVTLSAVHRHCHDQVHGGQHELSKLLGPHDKSPVN